MSQTAVQNFMNQYNLSEMGWGAYKICVNNTTYSNYDHIPLQVYKTYQNVKNYTVISTDTEDALKGFIIQRLFDKYYMNDTVIQIKNESDIHKLYNNNEFIIQFINFLKNQIVIDTMVLIENKIVDASRPTSIINEWGISQRVGTPSLDSNGLIRTLNRFELEDMDKLVKSLWDKVVTSANAIMK
jgi:hypothetical protein